MKNLSFLVLSSLLFLNACYYDIEEDLYPEPEGSTCNTEDVSFSATVVPILQTNCYVCHAADVALGGIILEGHSEVLKVANDGRLFGAISHNLGFSPMPQGAPQLLECDIQQIGAWIDAGALDD
ncbi:MAG: hypothetical protein R3E32_27055 [Chitinophagales bacterium]